MSEKEKEFKTANDETSGEESQKRMKSVVFDNGSHTIKSGLGDCHLPTTRIRNRSGWTKINKERIKYPISNGYVTNWDDLESIWHHVFKNELRVAPNDSNVMITSFGTRKENYKTAEIMFETFDINGIFIGEGAAFSLYSSGRTTGTVLNCGHDVSKAVSIYDGHVISQSISATDVSGSDVNNYLMEMLGKRGYSFSTVDDGSEIIRDIKEILLYFKINKNKIEPRDIKKTNYELPDGNVVTIGDERFRSPEVLFDPTLIDKKECQGIHKLTYDSIMRCDVDIRGKLLSNIVLSGGSTMFDGFKQRFENEMTSLTHSSNQQIGVYGSPERSDAAFIGGSILSSLSFFKEWQTKEDYDESFRMWYNPLRENPSSVRYSGDGDSDSDDDSNNITLKGNISGTRVIKNLNN